MSVRNRRMLSRTISTSEKLWKLKSFEAKLLFSWMICHCDDEGRMEGEPNIVKAVVFPLEKIKPVKIGEYLHEMSKIGLIKWYKVDGKRYIELENWDTFQTFHGFHKILSKIPSPITRSAPKRTKPDTVSTKVPAKIIEVNEVKERKKEGTVAYAKNLKCIGKHIGDEK